MPIIWFHHTLADIFNAVVEAGLRIERVVERPFGGIFRRETALGVAGRNLHPGAKTRLYKLENLARRRTFPLFPPPPSTIADRQNASALPRKQRHDDVRQRRLNAGIDAVRDPSYPDRHDEHEKNAEDSGRRLEARRHGQAL